MRNLILEKFKLILREHKLKSFVFTIILIFYGSFLLVPISLPHMDNDAGLYISDGKLIWETKTVFRTNVYSYTVPDYPVYDHHWLSSLTFYATHEIFGFEGLTILKTVILLVAFSILFAASLKKADFWLVAAASLPTILILIGRNRIRPEMFSYLFLATMLYLLFDAEKHPERNRIFWLIPLQLLWVNFHLYFFVGIAVVGGFLFEKITLRVPKKFWKIYFRDIVRDPLVQRVFLSLVFMVGVCFINPNGVEGALAPFKTHSYDTFTVSENQPLFNFKAHVFSWDLLNSSFVLMVIAFLISALVNYRQKPIFFLLAGVVSALAGLVQLRLITLFAVMFLPAIASNFNLLFLGWKEKMHRRNSALAFVAGYVLIFLLTSSFPYKAITMYAQGAERGHPTEWGIGLDSRSNDAAQFFKNNNIQGPIFNDYDIGGYILYHLFPREKVFVDNNGADSYPVEFFDNLLMPAFSSEERWFEVEQEYGLNAIFISLRNGSPTTGSFLWRRLHDPTWVMVYADTYAIIILKNNQQNYKTIERYHILPQNAEIRLRHMLDSKNTTDRILAGRLLYLIGRDDLAVSKLKTVVSEYPKNSWVWLYMGSLRVWSNNPQDLISAVIFLENAVEMGEKTSEGYTWLGLAYFRSSQFEKAEQAFQKALWLDPGRYDTTNYMNQLQEYLAVQ